MSPPRTTPPAPPEPPTPPELPELPGDKLLAAHDAHRRTSHKLHGKANVVGTGIGYKVVGGKPTGQPAVLVFVREKKPVQALKRGDRVPPSVGDVPTDVIETGEFFAHEAAPQIDAAVNTRRLRPARPGVSIAHYRVTAGTFGALVRDRESGQLLILSNNHVLANSATAGGQQARKGDPVLQPGPADGGAYYRDMVARLERFVELQPWQPYRVSTPAALWFERVLNTVTRFAAPHLEVQVLRKPRVNSHTNLVDAALARPVSPSAVNPKPLTLGPVCGIAQPRLGLAVQKEGRTTGVTSGVITALNVTLDVNYGNFAARFRDQLLLSPMSAPGDSGSLVVDAQGRAVALLFGGSDAATVATPVQWVVDALGIEFPACQDPGAGGGQEGCDPSEQAG